MSSSFMGKYKSTIILTLALAVFLASCKGATDDPKSWVVTTLAGGFNEPSGVDVDSSGNVYVADINNHRIRKITPTGEVSTFAGGTYGHQDGVGEAAQFIFPYGVAVDSSGNIYVAEFLGNRIRKITPKRVVSILAGSTTGGRGTTNGAGDTALFDGPRGVAVDSSGENVYVAGYANNIIRKITISPAGVGTVSRFAGSATQAAGDDDGDGLTDAQFDGPSGVAVDSSGNVYVGDTHNNRIRKITSDRVVSTFAGSTWGHKDATGEAAQFNYPRGVAVDSSGNLYVADMFNNRIRKITPTKEVSTIAGEFNIPHGVAVDSSGSIVYVGDTHSNRIRKIEYK